MDALANPSSPTLALPPYALAKLLEQVSRTLHSLGHTADLYPAQWSALRYFNEAAVNQRNASSLARYQGLETGSVNRTVRTLIAKGLLEKAGSLGRGRAQRIELTKAGRALIEHDPLNRIAAALGHLSHEERMCLAVAIEAVLRRTQGGGEGDEAPPLGG